MSVLDYPFLRAAPALGARRDSLIALTATAVLLAPLVVAVLCLRSVPYAPIQDAALIEERVRDVGTVHSPLVGVPGRMTTSQGWAHHPGPLAYYLLALPYRLFGASAWALLAATALMNGAAVALAVWVGKRQAGLVGALVVAVVVGILMQGYGLSALTEPWNPYYAVLWFVVFLVAIWAVARGDPTLLVLAAAAGTFCAQAHVAYLAVCGCLGGVAAISAIGWTHRASHGAARRRGRWALVATAVVLMVLWTPPLLQELGDGPGNLTDLLAYFLAPPGQPLGMSSALQLTLERVDVWHLLVQQLSHPGGLTGLMDAIAPSATIGALAECVWLLCAGAALRLGDRNLLALHGVHAVGTIVTVLASSRIVGAPFQYLLLWCWAFAGTLLVACSWTWVLLLNRAGALSRAVPGIGASLLFGAVLFLGARLSLTAPSASPGSPQVTARLAAVVPATLAAIERSVGAAVGPEGRYYVTATDAFYGSAMGIGLANELERAGIDARVDETFADAVGRHRTMKPRDARVRVILASGVWIAKWRDHEEAVEVASVDTRTEHEREEFDRLREAITGELARTHSKEAARRFEENTAYRPPFRLPVMLELAAGRLTEIGGPVAVFLTPL